MVDKALFSSATDEWATPQGLFDELNAEFKFDLDVCASHGNNKCFAYFTKEHCGLKGRWYGNVWCNPPYGKTVGDWVAKCQLHAVEKKGIAVMLLPARTDVRWFHFYIYSQPGVEIRFIRGRLKFGGSKNSAPFPSMIVIFR